MTTAELAARCHVSQRTIERWCSRDGMPHTRTRRVGGGYLIVLDEAAVAEWIAKRRWMLPTKK